ncbi:hypothetical protein BOX15_Mlig013686g2 [Macrostomum lignano]|uniref:Uncharacterized protein n=2 Tax=Macrostomum lignano TaxID=282301 RepID=A0A267G325_9PLAT|nr:hypothetical protein BOX15_Mlig013686g2 [Macrostomum lignano]
MPSTSWRCHRRWRRLRDDVEEAGFAETEGLLSGSFSAAQDANADDASADCPAEGEVAAAEPLVQEEATDVATATFRTGKGRSARKLARTAKRKLSRLFRRLWRGVRKSATSAGALSSGQDWLLGMEWLATLPAAGLKASG